MKKIKLFDPVIGIQEKEAVLKTLDSGFWASGAGTKKVAEFEDKFRKFVSCEDCISVNSGTAALHLALSLLDISKKEVIVPSLSFVSTAHAVLYNGGTPIFVDIEPNSLCIDPKEIEKKITGKTKAIVPVHFGGMPANIDEICKICREYDIEMIDDAAHATGASYKNKMIGSHGFATCFSFHPVKNLAMPTGGAITLNSKNKKFKSILKSKRWCGISNRVGSKYDVIDLGWNYYLNEISAAIGIVQLKKLRKLNTIRRNIAKQYSKELKIERKMEFNREAVYHLFWIRVKNRKSFMKKMTENNIETGIHYSPIHKMTFYNSRKKLANTEQISNEIVSIPIHPNLETNDIQKIIDCVNKYSK